MALPTLSHPAIFRAHLASASDTAASDGRIAILELDEKNRLLARLDVMHQGIEVKGSTQGLSAPFDGFLLIAAIRWRHSMGKGEPSAHAWPMWRSFMKTLVSICALAAAITLTDTAVQQWVGRNAVQAQSSSACVQNCVNVRRWPEAQCRRACAKKDRDRR